MITDEEGMLLAKFGEFLDRERADVAADALGQTAQSVRALLAQTEVREIKPENLYAEIAFQFDPSNPNEVRRRAGFYWEHLYDKVGIGLVEMLRSQKSPVVIRLSSDIAFSGSPIYPVAMLRTRCEVSPCNMIDMNLPAIPYEIEYRPPAKGTTWGRIKAVVRYIAKGIQ